jgi:hypothetical protein
MDLPNLGKSTNRANKEYLANFDIFFHINPNLTRGFFQMCDQSQLVINLTIGSDSNLPKLTLAGQEIKFSSIQLRVQHVRH